MRRSRLKSAVNTEGDDDQYGHKKLPRSFKAIKQYSGLITLISGIVTLILAVVYPFLWDRIYLPYAERRKQTVNDLRDVTYRLSALDAEFFENVSKLTDMPSKNQYIYAMYTQKIILISREYPLINSTYKELTSTEQIALASQLYTLNYKEISSRMFDNAVNQSKKENNAQATAEAYRLEARVFIPQTANTPGKVEKPDIRKARNLYVQAIKALEPSPRENYPNSTYQVLADWVQLETQLGDVACAVWLANMAIPLIANPADADKAKAFLASLPPVTPQCPEDYQRLFLN